ncbi:hypothetical protein DID77_01230 [Candidatus Marinamargulisbacteria bacterium SCGC AG-439-L15]|nr:hypothetical protein DID77_01230 [Candidatus Marinamargulisbacteria bacterium SCGC AG-439-L15]
MLRAGKSLSQNVIARSARVSHAWYRSVGAEKKQNGCSPVMRNLDLRESVNGPLLRTQRLYSTEALCLDHSNDHDIDFSKSKLPPNFDSFAEEAQLFLKTQPEGELRTKVINNLPRCLEGDWLVECYTPRQKVLDVRQKQTVSTDVRDFFQANTQNEASLFVRWVLLLIQNEQQSGDYIFSCGGTNPLMQLLKEVNGNIPPAWWIKMCRAFAPNLLHAALLRGNAANAMDQQPMDVQQKWYKDMARWGLDIVTLFNHQNGIDQMMAGLYSCEESGLNVFPAYSITTDPPHRYAFPGSWAPTRARIFFDELKGVFDKNGFRDPMALYLKEPGNKVSPQEASDLVQLVKQSEWGQLGLPTIWHGHNNGGFAASVAIAASQSGVDVVETTSFTPYNAQPNRLEFLNGLKGCGYFSDIHGGILTSDHRPVRSLKKPGLNGDAALFCRKVEDDCSNKLAEQKINYRSRETGEAGGQSSFMNGELGTDGVFDLMNNGYMQTGREEMGGSCQVTPYADHVFRLAMYYYKKDRGKNSVFPKQIADSILGKYGVNPGSVNPSLYKQAQIEMMKDQFKVHQIQVDDDLLSQFADVIRDATLPFELESRREEFKRLIDSLEVMKKYDGLASEFEMSLSAVPEHERRDWWLSFKSLKGGAELDTSWCESLDELITRYKDVMRLIESNQGPSFKDEKQAYEAFLRGDERGDSFLDRIKESVSVPEISDQAFADSVRAASHWTVNFSETLPEGIEKTSQRLQEYDELYALGLSPEEVEELSSSYAQLARGVFEAPLMDQFINLGLFAGYEKTERSRVEIINLLSKATIERLNKADKSELKKINSEIVEISRGIQQSHFYTMRLDYLKTLENRYGLHERSDFSAIEKKYKAQIDLARKKCEDRLKVVTDHIESNIQSIQTILPENSFRNDRKDIIAIAKAAPYSSVFPSASKYKLERDIRPDDMVMGW